MYLKIRDSFLSQLCLQKTVFIIDTITTAYAVAIMAKGHSIHCIYECKEITWRKGDYVALFDFILSDVRFLSKEIVYVPHPYLSPSKNLLVRIVRQMRFARCVYSQHALDPCLTYVSSMVSTLLIANKRYVKSILIDEGMGSVVARNRIAFRGSRLSERLKVAIGDRLLSFQFPNSTPQITLTNDSHSSVVTKLDYRDFDSKAFETSLRRLKMLINSNECKKNVLVLLKGPSAGATGHPGEAAQYDDAYLEFNLRGILAYLNNISKEDDVVFYLKSHPSLGSSRGKLNPLISTLKAKGIIAYDSLNYIDFPEASSIPAEGMLRYLNFEYVLALDASSLLWNAAYRRSVTCFMPLMHIINFSELEGGIHTELYRFQEKINLLMGGDVHFFDVSSSCK